MACPRDTLTSRSALASVGSYLPGDKQTQPGSDSSSVFAPILPTLERTTRVALRLPTYLAKEDEQHPLLQSFKLQHARAMKFSWLLRKTSQAGNACRYGTVSGRRVGSGGRVRGRPVSLAQGVRGCFVNATCGAVCSDSTLTWDQDGFRYTVGIKAEKLETLIKVANSAITKQPTRPSNSTLPK